MVMDADRAMRIYLKEKAEREAKQLAQDNEDRERERQEMEERNTFTAIMREFGIVLDEPASYAAFGDVTVSLDDNFGKLIFTNYHGGYRDTYYVIRIYSRTSYPRHMRIDRQEKTSGPHMIYIDGRHIYELFRTIEHLGGTLPSVTEEAQS